MSWYNVVKPCVVGQLHYVRPTTQPIQVDDEVAAPLVEAGCLEAYPVADKPEAWTDRLGDMPPMKREYEDVPVVVVREPEKPAPRPRRPRRTGS